jgi:hypothetical protein
MVNVCTAFSQRFKALVKMVRIMGLAGHAERSDDVD